MFDISIIENNPIKKLSSSTNNRFIEKIKQKFTNNEQKLFIGNFYCYLNYDYNEFIVDLDNIWNWLGFSTKQNAVRTLEKYFKNNIDYNTSVLIQQDKHEIGNKGGHNKIKYMLTIRCFKLLCLKAQTNKADEIHNYYLCLEELINESLKEDANELTKLLEQKDKYINEITLSAEEQQKNIIKNKNKEIEKAIIEQFPVNTECIYIGTIDDTNENNEKLLKFGHSNDLRTRVQYHHGNSYNNFTLIQAFKVNNRTEIENAIKNHYIIKKHIRKISINNKQKTEIIAYNTNFTIDKLVFYIKEIIKNITYSIENFNKLLETNKKQDEKIIELNQKLFIIQNEYNIIKLENEKLQNKMNDKEKIITQLNLQNESVFEEKNINNTEILIQKFIAECCIIRPDVEESAVNIEGQFRIWNKLKPTKEMFHILKQYFDTNFRKCRLTNQSKNQLVYGYIGIKLKPIEYKKLYASPNPVETFIFQTCNFSPSNKILNSTLLTEYIKWKKSVNLNENNNEMQEIKYYLNSCPYTLKAVVWTQNGSNEGYYGIDLKTNQDFHRKTSSTGKTVIKIELNSNIVLAKWETIAKASISENISASKMSRYIKNKTIVSDNYYYAVEKNI